MKHSDLTQIGLSKKEAKVYLACLELGSGSGQMIAEKARLAKSTTYDNLRSLSAKGLVNIYLKKRKKHFSANDPDVLRDKIKKQQEKLEEIYPELEVLFSEKVHKPKMRFLEGKVGMRVVLKEILNEASELLATAAVAESFEKLSEYFPKFAAERAKKKNPTKAYCS